MLRSRSETDQRMSVLELTETGRVRAQAHIPISKDAGVAFLEPLSRDERHLFLDLLRKVLPQDK